MEFQATRNRRQFFSSLAGAAGAVALGAAGWRSGVLAAGTRVGDLTSAAQASKPAVRVADVNVHASGELVLPADSVGGGLICLNNFRGNSTSKGSCGHVGVDIGEHVDNTPGRPLVACVDGVVERDGFLSAAGRFRVIRGLDGVFYRYHHLDAYEELLGEGDPVEAGQVIGYMGQTGNTSWTHLHFEVWLDSLIPRDGTPVDPVPLIAFPDDVQVDPSRACGA